MFYGLARGVQPELASLGHLVMTGFAECPKTLCSEKTRPLGGPYRHPPLGADHTIPRYQRGGGSNEVASNLQRRVAPLTPVRAL